MLDHVSITVSDLAKAGPFYHAVMEALGVACVYRRDDAVGFGARNRADDDSNTYLTVRLSDHDRIIADRRHWCFRAPDRAAVDAFHAAGLAAGGRCGGPPGVRPAYHESYYAAFLFDPDGNLIEAVTHRP
jgi:catechol 2,3-dioxygenase-like lactoylglutathione lyase family enzyme